MGTRGIRIVYGRCPYVYGKMKILRSEIEDALKLLKGMGVKKLCVAGGYQWREMTVEDALNNLEEVVPYQPPEESHGLRRLVRASASFDARLLPSGGASGEVPQKWLLNALDTATPDKIAKANFVRWRYGISTFTLVDLGCYVSLIYVEDGAVTRFVSATRGMPGKCSPGLIDIELLLLYEWPTSREDIHNAGVDEETVKLWLDFYRPTFVGEEVICPSRICDEYSAAEGAFLWCCGLKLKHMFSDRYVRHLTIKGRVRPR